MKNIFKKIIVLFSLIIILFGYNFVFADSDTVPPAITITGSNPMDVIVGSSFTDPGATAIDDIDSSVVVSTSDLTLVNTTKVGVYTIIYTATDKAGNTATSTRTVNITPILSSIAITTPAKKLSYLVGSVLDISGLSVTGTYSDDSTKLETITSDNITGFDSSKIIMGQVLTITLGTQTITYSINIITTTPIQNENIIIRNGDSILYNGTIPFPSVETIDIADNVGKIHSVNTDSVLGIIYSLSQKEDALFSFSNLKYYDGMGFMIKCITPKDSVALCDNWQYTVNGSYPWDSIDSKILSGGEKIGIYFGSQNKLTLNSNSITTNDILSVSSLKYNYEDNTWITRTGITVGLTQLNPDDPWNPKDDIKSLVDVVTGIVKFSSIPEGTYNVGIKEDGYWPTEKLIVLKPVENNGGGSYTAPVVEKTFSSDDALSFLSQNQKSNGSFISPMYTDWVAIAASAGNNSSLKSSISNYLKSNPVQSSFITDYERRAMALMSLGINPYSGTNVNYIQKIIDSFDGTQFGDPNLTNDDIFALIPLANSGYTKNDSEITKDIVFILSKQQSDGSWENSVDLTSAAIQAISSFGSVPGVSSALSKASSYLQSIQGSDGGWGNVSSSSWASQAMNTLGESWIKNNKNVYDYFGSQQAVDGATIPSSETLENRIWATSYAVPAVMKLSWNNILNNFDKPIVSSSLNSSNSVSLSSEEFVEPVKIIEQADQINTEVVLPKISLDLPQKIIKKKIIASEITTTKPSEIISVSDIKIEVPINNNLTASAGDAITTGFSMKGLSQAVVNFMVNTFNYVGNSFSRFLSLIHVF